MSGQLWKAIISQVTPVGRTEHRQIRAVSRVRWGYSLSRCLTAVLGQICAEFCPLTQPNPPSSDKIRLHTDAMTVSERAWQAPAPWRSTIRTLQPVPACQGPSHDEFCVNGARTVAGGDCYHDVLREVGNPLSSRYTSWPENMGTLPCVLNRRIQGPAVGQWGRTSRAQSPE